ncbi:MAG TPA: metallophosphoesterase family protein [Polyangiaceae bacterium]
MRFIFIGDVHGCIDEFRELVRKACVRSGDRVICLGDFMDKGPDPVACVRFARENGFSSILGNHEQKHLKWRRNEASLPEESRAQNAALDDDDIAWLEGLPVLLEPVPGFVAVHGGLFPGIPLAKQPTEAILRARYVNDAGEHVALDWESPTPIPPGARHWSSVYDGTHDVVYGHEPHSLSTVRQSRSPSGAVCYGIDTGCVHGGHLTALILDGQCVSFVQARARRVYKNPLLPIPS